MADRFKTKTKEERERERNKTDNEDAQSEHGPNGEKCIDYTNIQLNEVLAYNPILKSALINNKYLEKGSSLVLCGQAGIGKSRLATQFSICCVTGIPFIGWQTNDQELRIWILQNENSDVCVRPTERCRRHRLLSFVLA